MGTGYIIILALQTVATLCVAVTLMLYFQQLRVMREQLAGNEAATSTRNLVALIDFLEKRATRTARGLVMGELAAKELMHWTADDRHAAARVCASYHLAAVLVRRGAVSPELLIDNWGPSIADCHRVLVPFIREMRTTAAGERHWEAFDWLAGEVGKHFERVARPAAPPAA